MKPGRRRRDVLHTFEEVGKSIRMKCRIDKPSPQKKGTVMNLSETEKKAVDLFKELKRNGLIGMKFGTEAEKLSFEEMQLLKTFFSKIGQGALPIWVKIGGPGASNDIRKALYLGVDGVIGPMVESLYALGNFVTVVKEIVGDGNGGRIGKGINIESISGFNCMEELITGEWGKELNEIVIGRSDLAASCRKTVDSPEIMEMARKVCETAKANGKRVSLGGQITTSNIENIVEYIQPNQIHTRMLILDPERMGVIKHWDEIRHSTTDK